MARTYVLKTATVPSRLGIPYDRDLNDEQRDVVFAPDGPCLVVAGAGSGKTRALTYRVAYLLDRGVPPSSILLLTFTNRAARQMLERVEQLCGGASRLILGGTFHHVANALLKEHAEVVGYKRNFTILDREDAREVLQAACAELGLDIKTRRLPKADVVLELISSALNEQKLLSEVLARDTPHFLPVAEPVVAMARQYVMRKVAQNVMDFDDLLMNLKVLAAEESEVSRALRQRFQHVLVDEYQDTNQLQGDLVDLLGSGNRNVMAVGDDAQSIYSFRGANFENIMGFARRYPTARMARLEVNYRSTPEILSLANTSIRHNQQRHDKTLRAVRPHGAQPALVSTRDVFAQASFVAQRVLELRDEGVSLKEVAVLYRAHHHALELQVELTRRGIPFVVRSGLRFFEQAHIKDVLAYVRFVHNPLEELALRRSVKLHEGVGNAAAQSIWEHTAEGLKNGEEVRQRGFLVKARLPGTPRALAGLTKFATLVEELWRPSVRDSAQEQLRAVLDGGYRDYLRKSFPNAREREQDIEQLSDYCAAFGSIEEMLAETSLMESISGETVLSVEESDEKLTLSSIHQAKGLEWSRVFLVWLCDGRMPTEMALRDVQGEEEERRVFYVACTRAKDELYLVHPCVHQGRDRSMVVMRPSRFLSELGDTSRDVEGSLWERWVLAVEHTAVMSAGPQPVAQLPDGE